MRKFPVDEVWVQVTKPHPPVAVALASVAAAVELHAGRPRGLRSGRIARRSAVRAFLGLGSNLGDTRADAPAGPAEAGDVAWDLRWSAESSLYATAPVGGPEQDDYLNQVVEMRTALSPRELLQRPSVGSRPSWAGNVW